MNAAGDMLKREIGLFSAVMMGLGSIVGTGVFVSIGVAAGLAGPAVVLAIALAALLALCNALSSAQLAANHPVSGGTYEYGYRYLTPSLGFAAGWTFLCAKSASAATAALGFAGYSLQLLSLNRPALITPIALAAVALLTLLVLAGAKRTGAANILIAGVTLLALGAFIVAGVPTLARSGAERLTPVVPDSLALPGFLEAAALMFVAYTGYGRIATLGEEVRDPRTTIPRAIAITLAVSATLYIAVALVAVAAIGAPALADATMLTAAPLEAAALALGVPGVPTLIAVGAVTAMLGVLLNLILGLSRVLLAMGRRADMPAATARLNAAKTTPTVAVAAVGAATGAIALLGSLKLAWSLSAFTVLLYYAITNAAALRLRKGERLYHPAIAWAGLLGCLGLAFWVEWRAWLGGLALIALGFLVRTTLRRLRRPPA